ncbi:amidohydrolase family protein [Castellaniella sp.]|uniref:amidohydrolase family protein n=1 Tax=Castellaniella sp. TaxID=1955812 RepID=UPI00355DA602
MSTPDPADEPDIPDPDDPEFDIELPDIPGPMDEPSRPRLRLPAGSCDAHAHIFGPAGRFPYSRTRDYTPHDVSRVRYASLLHHLGFQRAVLVQPSVYGTDNRCMLTALAAANEDPLGITWRGIAVADHSVTDEELLTWHTLGVRGLRLNLLFRGADVDFEQISDLADRISHLGWHLQILMDISSVEHFADTLAELPVDVVFDHMGHFGAWLGVEHPSFRELLALMQEGRCWVKLSGPKRISAYPMPPFVDVVPIAYHLLAVAPNRVVFGTDWPHVRVGQFVPDDGMLVDELRRWVDDDDELWHQVLVDNPAELYGFGGSTS